AGQDAAGGDAARAARRGCAARRVAQRAIPPVRAIVRGTVSLSGDLADEARGSRDAASADFRWRAERRVALASDAAEGAVLGGAGRRSRLDAVQDRSGNAASPRGWWWGADACAVAGAAVAAIGPLTRGTVRLSRLDARDRPASGDAAGARRRWGSAQRGSA